MEFWKALAIVGSTLACSVGVLAAFWKPIKVWLDARDEANQAKKELSENNTQTEQNRQDIENMNKTLVTLTEQQEITNKRLQAGDTKFKALEADMKLLTNGQLEGNGKLDLVIEQTGLIASLLLGDESAKMKVSAIGNAYKKREEERISGVK